MKKIILPFITFLVASSIVFSQADTIVVPGEYMGSSFGAINRFIVGDTTATGERVNPDRYYKLQKNTIYFLDGIFFSDFDLRLIADDVEPGETPPIVASTVGADGTIQLIQFKLFANGYVKNIIFQMTPPTGNGESNACFFLSGEGKTYEFDNVRIEWGLWTGMVTEVPVNKITVKNCYFRNPQHKTNIWNGRGLGFYQENPADTVIMQNNTFFNMNSFAFFADISSIPPNYFVFDHNTIVNSMKFPIHSFWLPDATVTNNIFYNAHSYGENSADVVGQDPDGLKYGIINIDEIPSDLIEYYGIEESERKYEVANNCFFYEDAIYDYWNSYGLDNNPFMNQRVLGMFNDDTGYPALEVSNTISANPNFIEPGEGMAAMITWMSNRRDLMGNTYWGWDPDNDKFAVQWPFPENLAYSNETIKTAADEGYPLGDLNWWPELKERWEQGLPPSAAYEPFNQIDNILISPSPAKDNFSINYDLEERSDIFISIYAITGKKIADLFKGTQLPGNYNLDWTIDNNINSGIYLIRFSNGNGTITKKVVIQK